jgi:Family of unknown function (DUF5317)
VLGPQGGLDTVEQPLQPAEELGLGDAELGLALRTFQGFHYRVEFFAEVRRQRFPQLSNGGPIHVGQTVPALLIERNLPDLFDDLPDHRGDPKELGRLGDDLLVVVRLLGGSTGLSRRDDLGSDVFVHRVTKDIASPRHFGGVMRRHPYHERMLLLLGSILAIGLLLGWGLGGGLRNLAHVHVVWWYLFPAALVLQVLPIPQAESGIFQYLPFAVLLLSYLTLIVAVMANWSLRGFPLILLGLLLNLVPIAVNRGMPVSGEAVIDAGGRAQDVPTSPGGKHHLATPSDQVTFLGDVIPIRDPFRTVVSVGDVVMYAGAAWFVAAAMLVAPSRPPEKRVLLSRRTQPSTTWGSPR